MEGVAVGAEIENKEDLSLVNVNTKRKKIERKRKLTKDHVLIATKEIERKRSIDLCQNHKTDIGDMKIIMKEKRKKMRGLNLSLYKWIRYIKEK